MPPASAADFFAGGVSTNWSDPLNWGSGTAPTGLVPDDLHFYFLSDAEQVNDVAADFQVHNLYLESGYHGTISGQSLFFTDTSPTVFMNTDSPATVANDIRFLDTSNMWGLTFDSAGAGAGNLTLSGTIASNGVTGMDNVRYQNTLSAVANHFTVTGHNSYTGSTEIVGQTILTIGSDFGLGAAGGGTLVSDGSTLQLTGGITLRESALTLEGFGVGGGFGGGAGALQNVSGNNTVLGTIAVPTGLAQINSDAGLLTIEGDITGTKPDNNNVIFGGAGEVRMNGDIQLSANVLMKNGAGTLTLAGTATSSMVMISSGTLALVGAGSIGSAQVNDDGIFDISGTTAGATIGILGGSGILNLGDRTLSIDGAGLPYSSIFEGTIQGSGGITSAGASQAFRGGDVGSLTLSAIGTIGGSSTSFLEFTGVTADSPTLVADGGALEFGADLGTPGAPGSRFTGHAKVSASHGGLVSFRGQDTSVGAANISVSSAANLQFSGRASAGSSIISVDGAGSSLSYSLGDAGTSHTTLSNGALLYLLDAGTVGSTLQDATITASSESVLDVSLTLDASASEPTSTTIGSLSGPVDVYLGGSVLTLGSLNRDDVISGVIADGTSAQLLSLTASSLPQFTGGSLVKVGTGTLTLTGANTYTGGTTINSGTLMLGNGGVSGSLQGDVNDNGTLAFNRSDAITFAGSISGTGGLAQVGSGGVLLTADSSFSGPTDVFAGTLAVQGSIAHSAVLVHSAATLSGSGTVGATTVASGGTVVPGDGFATLSVNGAYSQQGGSIYQVQVDPTSTASGIIAVTGNATLADGARINVTKTTDAPYVLGRRYTVLTTTGGREGTFDLTGETDLTAFIRLSTAYDTNNAYLVTEQSRSLGTVGKTPNQIATGRGIDSQPESGAVKTAILNLQDEASARDALEHLSGEIHASLKTAAIENGHFVRDAATGRIREAFCGVEAPVTIHNEPNEGSARLPPSTGCGFASDRPMAWGQAFGSWGHTDSDGNAGKLDRSIGGLFFGTDALVSNTARFGVLGGFSRSNLHVDSHNSSATSDEYHLGLYGGMQRAGVGFRTGVTYTWQDLSTDRFGSFMGGNDKASADYRAGVTQIFGDLGYRIAAGDAALEPFANLAYMNIDTHGFSEQGGAAAFSSEDITTHTSFAALGLRASMAFELGNVNGAVGGSLGWRHAFADTTPISKLAFEGGSSFDIAGVPVAKDATVVNAGVDFAISANATVGISYGGQFYGGATDQSARGSFSLKF